MHTLWSIKAYICSSVTELEEAAKVQTVAFSIVKQTMTKEKSHE